MTVTDDANSLPPPLPASYLLLADVLHMLLAATLLSMFLFVGTEVPLVLQLIITGLIVVVMVRGGGWLVLGAMQVSMFFYETRANDANVHLSTIVYGGFCLAFVAYAAGFRTIRRLLREWLGRMLHELIVAPPFPGNRSMLTALDTRQDRLKAWVWLRQRSGHLLLRASRLLLIVIAASIAFVQLPFTKPGIDSWWTRSIDLDFKLWPGPNLFTLAIICLVAMTLGSWKGLGAKQARLYLKSLYVCEHYRELRSILIRGKYLSQPLHQPKMPMNAAAPVRHPAENFK